jgi:hypothetical protein
MHLKESRCINLHFRGGTTLTVSGEHMDAVAHPMMNLTQLPITAETAEGTKVYPMVPYNLTVLLIIHLHIQI